MKNESEFMHELRKAIHAKTTEFAVNKIAGYVKALIAEVKVVRGFNYKGKKFKYYLN